MARMGERRIAYRFLASKSEGERDHLEGLGVERRIILKFVVKE